MARISGIGSAGPGSSEQRPPALLNVLISFAYLEEDGALLCATLIAALLLIAATAAGICRRQA